MFHKLTCSFYFSHCILIFYIGEKRHQRCTGEIKGGRNVNRNDYRLVSIVLSYLKGNHPFLGTVECISFSYSVYYTYLTHLPGDALLTAAHVAKEVGICDSDVDVAPKNELQALLSRKKKKERKEILMLEPNESLGKDVF